MTAMFVLKKEDIQCQPVGFNLMIKTTTGEEIILQKDAAEELLNDLNWWKDLPRNAKGEITAPVIYGDPGPELVIHPNNTTTAKDAI